MRKNNVLRKSIAILLVFLIVITVLPIGSHASDNVVKIENLTVRLTKGAEKVDDDWVWKTKQNSSGHRFVYRVTYAISGTREYEPEKVEIRIPKQVLLDRENKFADEYEMSIPAYDDPDLEGSNAKYVYKEDGEEIVIYNRISVPGGDNGYFEVAYDTTKRTFDYADYGADSDESGPFKATMHIEQDEMSADKETDEVFVYIDTNAKIDRTQKAVSGKYNNWQTSWGDEPVDADDYYYIVWQVRTWIKSPTQPYNFRIVDTFDTSVNGEVVGYRYQGESKFTENHWIEKQVHYSQNDRYDYVLTKYSKSDFINLDYYELTNNVVATVDPYDEVDEDTTAYSNAIYRFEKPRYIKPTGHFDTEKRGLDYRDRIVRSSDDVRSFKLTDFQKEKIDRIDNLKYATYTIGYQWPWTLDGDWQDPSNYGKKNVKTVIWDNEWYINKSNVGLTADYNEEEKLTKNDFELKKIEFSVSASSAVFNEEAQGFKQVTPDYTSSDYIDFYGEFDGTWRKVARYSIGTKTFSNLASSSYLNSASGRTIQFASNCTGWKAEYSNKFFKMECNVYPYVDLKNSARIKEECADKDKVSLLNVMRSEMYDSSNKKLVEFNEMGTDYIIGIDKHGHIRKEVNNYKNNKVKKNYTVNWKVEAWEDFRDVNAEQTYVTQESGTFYDLAPLGGEINKNSIKVWGNEQIEDFDAEIKKNYKNSGRDLLVVKINNPTDKTYKFTYSTVHSWDSIKDTGNVFHNEVAYETGNDDIGDGLPDNGGNLSSKEIMNNLDSDTDAEKFLYSSAYHSADILTSANLGLLKKVKDSTDEDYSYKTMTTANGEYSYKIRFATDDETKARDLILFDSLENYIVQEQGQDSHTSDWYGKLQFVDLTAVKKLGVKPQVYLSSSENLDLSVEANHDLSNSSVWKKQEDFGNIENAKAVAIDMRYKEDDSEYILPKDTGVSVVLNMKAPSDININKEHIYTFNNIYLNNIAIDSNDTEEHFYVHQDYTQVEYRISASVKMTKVNANDHDETIKGMTFSLTGTSDYGTEVNETQQSNSRGYATFEDVEKGTYTLKETKTNDDWLLNGQAYTVKVDYQGNVSIEGLEESNGRFLFENKPRVHGDLDFRKKSLGQDEETLRIIDELKNITPGSTDLITIDGVDFICLKKEGSKVLVMENPEMNGRGGLPVYKDKADTNKWSDSEIRRYLNTIYLETHPILENLSVPYKIKSGYDIVGETEGTKKVEETTDKVFLLSFGDVVPDLIPYMNSYNHTSRPSVDDKSIEGITINRTFLVGNNKKIILRTHQNYRSNSAWNNTRLQIVYGTSLWDITSSEYRITKEYNEACMWLDISNTKPQLNISNTTFKLEGTSDYGTEVTEYLTSNSVGRVEFKNLEKGKYTLIETKANPDYIKNPEKWDVIVDENGQVIIGGAKSLENGTQYLENEPYHNFSLRKVDADDNTKWLEGAEFSLTGTSNYGSKVDMTDTSRNTGRVTFDMLESGTYVLKETKAPDKYQLDEKEYLVEIDKYGNVTIDGHPETDEDDFILFENEKSYEGKIKITKKWKDGLTGEDAANRENPVITISTKEEKAFKGNVLTYDANGGVFANGKKTNRVRVFQENGATIEESIVDGTYKEPIHTGEDYKFEGWYFDKECTQPMVDSTYLTQDRTVYAKWGPKTEAYARYCIDTNSLVFFRDEPGKYTNKQFDYDNEGNECIYYTGIETAAYDFESGVYPPWEDYNRDIVHIMFEDNIKPISTSGWFGRNWTYHFEEITVTGIENLDTSKVTNMSYMFYGCEFLYSLDTSHFDTSKVTNIRHMFTDCPHLVTTLNIMNMPAEYDNIAANTENHFQLTLKYIFPVTNEDITTIINANSESNIVNGGEGTFTPPDTSGVYNENNPSLAAQAIMSAKSDKDKQNTNWKSEKTLLSGNKPTELVDTASAATEWTHFGNGGNVEWQIDDEGTLILRPENGASEGTMGPSTSGALPPWYQQTTSIKSIRIANNTTITAPFNCSRLFEACGNSGGIIDLTGLNTNNTGYMEGMFYGTSATTINLGDKFDTSNVTNMSQMFSNSSATTINLGDKFDASNVTNMYAMFSNSSATTINLGDKFDTSKVKNMGYMFNGTSVTTINLGDKFDTSKVEDMEYMFNRTSATTINLGDKFDTSNVTDMQRMFRDCSNVTFLDVSHFDTSNVTEMRYIFSNTPNLKTIALGEKSIFPQTMTETTNSNWEQYATLSLRKVYDGNEFRNISDYDGSVPGWYKIKGTTAPNESEVCDAYSTADDQSKWVKESDDTWTYTFDVHNDEAKYYVWEEMLEGYESDTYKIDFQIINDPENPEKNVKSATITNTQENIPPEREETMPGNLIISKTVTGEDLSEVDTSKLFGFDVTFTDSEIAEGTKIINGIAFKDGKGTIHLKHDEKFEFKELPAGTKYTVSEKNQDDYTVASEGENGTILGNKTSKTSFVNNKKSTRELPRNGFTLKKQVKGNLGDLFEDFTFNISFSNLSASAVYTFSDGTAFRSDENGSAETEVKLKSGDEVNIAGLPVGSKYKITEASSRYIAEYEITDSCGGVNIVQPRDANDDLWTSLSTRKERVDEDEDIAIKFTNTRELEITTGVQNQMIILYVIALIILLMILFKWYKKRIIRR